MGRAHPFSLLALLGACGRIGFDGSGPPTVEPACDNAIHDEGELGIDCGPTCGVGCAGQPCGSDVECVTGVCDAVCELASGPPFWIVGPRLTAPRDRLQCVLFDDAIWCIGGRGAVTVGTVDALARGASAFADLDAPLATPRHSHAAMAASNGKVYVAGGYDPATGYLRSVEVFDGSWVTSAIDSPQEHASTKMVEADGTAFLFDINTTMVFDLASETWSTDVDPAPEPSDQAGLAREPSGAILTIGGNDRNSQPSRRVAAFDPVTRSWSLRAELPEGLRDLTAVAAPDGRVYALAGSTGSAVTAAARAYRPTTNTWTDLAPLAIARVQAGTSLGPDGRIYVLGGALATSEPTAEVESYGPRVLLEPATVPPGVAADVELRGANFARDAAVAVRLDGAIPTLAAGTTDGIGEVSLSLRVPALAAGRYTLTAIDARSQYPVTAILAVE